jgi:hypothetical protein
MNRSSKLIWTGPLFAVVFLLSDLLFEGNAPGEKSSGAQVVSYFNEHRGRSMAEVFLAPVIVALLILFVSEFRSRARRYDPEGVGATVMVSGAVILAAGAVLGASVLLGLVSAAQHHQDGVAQTLNVVNNDDWIAFISGLAVFMIGAGITVLQSGVLPKWLGWVALVVGIVSLAGPGGFVGYFATPLWIIVSSVILGMRKPTAGSDEESNRPATTEPVGV